MILFVKDNCPDCTRVKEAINILGLPLEVFDGESILKDALNGHTTPFNREEVLELLTVLAVQDDIFPVLMTDSGNFLGRSEISDQYGISLEAK